MGDIFFRGFFAFFGDWLKDIAVTLCTSMVQIINEYIIDFFENQTIDLFLDFSKWLNVFIFCACLIVVIVDLVEEKSSGNHVAYTDVFGNIFKGFIFAVFARWIAVGSLELVEKVLSAFNFNLSMEQIDRTIGEIVKDFVIPTSNHYMLLIIFYIVMLCACVVFFISALKRFGTMFIHIFTSFLYISDVMRGNTVKMGEWLRQMFSISLTYAFTYLLFFLGCNFFNSSSYLIAIAMWITMSMVPKILSHYGWSSGTKGSFGGLLQTGTSLIKSFK